MKDPRLEQLAHLMLTHSMKIQKGDYFHITADITGLPLVKALLRQSRQLGALAEVQLTQQEVDRLLLEQLNPDDDGRSSGFLTDLSETGIRQFENKVGDIRIRAYANDQEQAAVAADNRQLYGKFMKPFRDLIINHRRWVLFEYPTAGQAQRAGMSYDDYLDFVLDASSVDYQAMQRDVQPLAELMRKTRHVRLTGKDTDLSFSIENIPVIPCCGEFNIPDGECFTAPVRDSVNGELLINTPTVYWGKIFHDIRLTFKDGRIIKATARDGVEDLNRILDSDDGARYIGEFAIGFNPKIMDPFMNTLFDEKISGSFHFTPGACYDDAPNGNDSTIHWDLVHIQRPEYGGGSIWFDGNEIRRDGLFTLPELAALNP
ncbi:MAG: aminopeptidase [Eubacteriales bacterium]|nr:aminopeptidase [Eubacteriales bacterium]MDD3866151.1 aminopeptidase [Eubacteriales bacterium]MDD4461309.1 aminopeptidase [Eubacteriales bacterium]